MTVGALGSAAYDGRRLQAPALLFEGASGHSDRPLALAGSSEVGQQAIARVKEQRDRNLLRSGKG